jgi:hypothetical protein
MTIRRTITITTIRATITPITIPAIAPAEIPYELERKKKIKK